MQLDFWSFQSYYLIFINIRSLCNYKFYSTYDFNIAHTMKIISDINHSKVKMTALVDYIIKQNKAQKYNDYYDFVPIAVDKIMTLKNIIY